MPHRRHLLVGAAALAAMPAQAQPVKITLGTATPGGGFPVYGAAFVEGVRRADPGLEIDAINTKGSTENVPRLEAGTQDLPEGSADFVTVVRRQVAQLQTVLSPRVSSL